MSSTGRRKKRTAGSGRQTPGGSGRRRADLAPYVAFVLIWLFASALAYLSLREHWMLISAAILAGFGIYVTWCTAQATLGRPLMAWQKGLVRLPLILAGGGSRRVEQMKADRVGRLAVLIAFVGSLLLMGLVVYVALTN